MRNNTLNTYNNYVALFADFQPPLGSTEKPTEIFHIMEHFCLGRRRLHLFGSDDTLRPGNINLSGILVFFFFEFVENGMTMYKQNIQVF